MSFPIIVDPNGLDAQRRAVVDYLDGGKWELIGEFTEVESGKRNDRPELAKAIALCKRAKARLVIAKLDRLSRNLAFIATMMEGRVHFVCCDAPEADETMLHMMGVMAHWERKQISKRTKEALAAARARIADLPLPADLVDKCLAYEAE